MSQSNYVLLIMYDVGFDDKPDKVAYRKLFRYLQRSGFYPLQQSIYCKPLSEKQKAQRYLSEIRKIEFEKAHIRSLTLTWQTFITLEAVVGEDNFTEKLIKQSKSVIRV